MNRIPPQIQQELIEFESQAGDNIENWIKTCLSIENGCKRKVTKKDQEDFDGVELNWIFSQKGERLYRSYLSKVQHLRKLKFPYMQEYYNEIVTGVIYP